MSSLQQVFSGRVWKVGDSVDTNQLAGGGIQGATAKETLRINCLRGLRPDFTENVAPGEYFLTTQVIWGDEDAFFREGGTVYDSVTLTGKETEPVSVILSGN